MALSQIATDLMNDDARVILIYAFNTVGKTRLSVAFKDATKEANGGQHAGVYYNAFSEDLFVWNNDEENGGENIRLLVTESSLNRFYSILSEDAVREKLRPYRPTFDFAFDSHDDPERGIRSIAFFPAGKDGGEAPNIKISRAEERIFVWCFFLALFEVEGWADQQSAHFFIDDPVSSLDDHNIFVTASSVLGLVERYHGDRKIIITTHHIGFFSTIANWLMKGEEADRYKKITKVQILNKDHAGQLSLSSPNRAVFLYHLHLLRELSVAREENRLKSYHLVLLRQVLENVASFLGVGQFSYVLQQIGIQDPDEMARIINILSHKKAFTYEGDEMVPDTRALFDDVFDGLRNHYKFVLHEDNAA
ncbi:MAG: AAA family ATPase [Rhodospirillales bacterium]